MKETGMRTRVKICGLTRGEDLYAAVDAGADALGLVCYEGSKRYVPLEQAASLRQLAPSFVPVVALFVNAKPETVRAVIDQVGPDLLQFHGDESGQECAQYGRRYLRAFRVGGPGLRTQSDVLNACSEHALAEGWLFDSYTPQYGGSGQPFDHGLLYHIADSMPGDYRVILSGGLTADNVAEAVRTVRPWAVDVSSGVETAPGIKSAEKIQAFIEAVGRADRRQ